MKKILILLLLSAGLTNIASAKKIEEPVSTVSEVKQSGDTVFLKITFNPSKNWIVYDSIIGEGGPIPLTFNFDVLENVKLLQVKKPELHQKHDDIFEVDMLYFSERVEYTFVFIKNNSNLSGTIIGEYEFMCCNLISGVCLAPRTEPINTIVE